MIDRTYVSPVSRQAMLLGISRSSVYYAPRPVSDAHLARRRHIDESHREHSFAGAAWCVGYFGTRAMSSGASV
ncbi:hypothetical protein [Paraburkholderia sp. BCC1885]|uniref:hypothetical protein n=1 Tax=Paraburkholderia sp. BCC1885 TaxID=2562669 RepID=UPI001182D666|nr:hypothetical protein [Paraburkholderia sp. BCC1885]